MEEQGHVLNQQTQNQTEANDETLSPEEVSAIVKRYGEQQSGEAPSRVSDVAEALQVDRSVVTRLLQDIRKADTEKQLRERLDRLERDNEQLRARAEISESDVGSMFGSGHWTRRRYRRNRRASMLTLGLAAVVASAIAQNGGHLSSTSPIIFAIAIVAFVVIVARRFQS